MNQAEARQIELLEVESNQRQHYEYLALQDELRAATIKQEYALIGTLKPLITKDGNQWCVHYGNCLADGVAGFGDTPHEAVIDFNNNWHKK